MAVPTWIVECTYAKNAKAKITTVPEPENGEEIAYNHDFGFQRLMINAQTGKAYDPYSTESSRKVYRESLRAPEIIGW